MKIIKSERIAAALKELIQNALCDVSPDVLKLIGEARTEGLEKFAVDAILENARIAAERRCFACQDTGLAVIFAEVGGGAAVDGDLTEAITDGVRQGYAEARKSVCDPLTRLNTGDNAPPIIHYTPVKGDSIKLTFLAKGAGSENMSAVYMLTPSKGEDGIVDAVADCVRRAGANPCPPIIIGVGVGGDFELCAALSKRALLRPVGRPADDSRAAALERRILDRVNALNIGAQGFGGKLTALAAAVETYPTHIGMLPVGVNIQCHSVRHGSVTI